jgi:hypothetical protein
MKIVKVVKSKDQTALRPTDSNAKVWEFRCCLDPEKMHAYEAFLKKNAKGKIIADLGTGPGIMGYLALKYGAKKVYFVDFEQSCLDAAKLTTEDLKGKKSFHLVDLRTDDLSFMSDIDIAIHEIFGHNIYDEYIRDITYNFQKHRLNSKLVPVGVEWYEIKSNQDLKYTTCRADYVASNFPEVTKEFHGVYKEKVEDWTDINLYDRMMSHDWNQDDVVWDKIGETNLTEYDLCDWVPHELSVYKNEKTRKIFSWAAKLDDDISYRGPGRHLNNWMLMPGDVQHKRRFVSAVRFGRSINPYHGDI